MNEQKNPFDLLVDQIRLVVREELSACGITNGREKPLTAEQLAEILQINKATVYEQAKAGEIPYLKVGRFLRFNLGAVLEARKKNENAC